MMKLVKDTKVYAKRRNGNKNRPGPFILFDLTEKLLRPLLLRFLFFVLFLLLLLIQAPKAPVPMGHYLPY